MNPVAVSPEAKLDLSAYLEKARAPDAPPGMIELLRQLATKGWAEVGDRDRRAELAARHHLSGTIPTSTVAPGLPLEALDPSRDGQVAVVSSQAMRLKIAHALQALGSTASESGSGQPSSPERGSGQPSSPERGSGQTSS